MSDKVEKHDEEQVSETRGPKFPSISLEKALDLAQKLYDKERRAAVAVPVILSHWGYKNPKSSTATMAVAALRSYGLLEYQGSGPNRTGKLSSGALKILLNTPEKDAELKKAALAPNIHQGIWEKYKDSGLPSDESLKHHLILDLDFNDTAVDAFLGRLRNTFSLAKLTNSGTLPQENANSGKKPAVGDRVQWISQGVAQFPDPCPRVVSLSDDGLFVFVESTNTGLPVGEVVVVEVATKDKPPEKPPGVDIFDAIGKAVSTYRPPQSPVKAGVKQDVFTTEGGQFVVQWPATMTADEFEDVKGWLEILTRKIGRSVTGTATPGQ